MEIDVFFVREKTMAKQSCISHIPALDQWANVLTKSLSSVHFVFSSWQISVKSFYSEKSSR